MNAKKSCVNCGIVDCNESDSKCRIIDAMKELEEEMFMEGLNEGRSGNFIFEPTNHCCSLWFKG